MACLACCRRADRRVLLSVFLCQPDQEPHVRRARAPGGGPVLRADADVRGQPAAPAAAQGTERAAALPRGCAPARHRSRAGHGGWQARSGVPGGLRHHRVERARSGDVLGQAPAHPAGDRPRRAAVLVGTRDRRRAGGPRRPLAVCLQSDGDCARVARHDRRWLCRVWRAVPVCAVALSPASRSRTADPVRGRTGRGAGDQVLGAHSVADRRGAAAGRAPLAADVRSPAAERRACRRQGCGRPIPATAGAERSTSGVMARPRRALAEGAGAAAPLAYARQNGAGRCSAGSAHSP